MMVVGGLGKTWGPLLGGAALMLADEVLKDYPEYRFMGVGFALVIFVMVWPQGIVGAIEGLWRRLFARRTAAAGAANSPGTG
jgi:branched-chain amino acid transport system permease protein